MAFTVVGKKNIAISDLSLCPTMDLVAMILKANGQVCVYRTFSWELVCSVSASDLFAHTPCVVRWSPTGRLLCVGSEAGDLCLLDVENDGAKVQMEYKPLNVQESHSRVCDVFWIDGERLHALTDPVDNSICGVLSHIHTHIHKHIHPIVKEENDTLTDETTTNTHTRVHTLGVGDHIMVCVKADGCVEVYSLGSVCVYKARTPYINVTAKGAGGVCLNDMCIAHTHMQTEMSYFTIRGFGTQAFQRYRRVLAVSLLLSSISAEVSVVADTIRSCARHWKDSCKILKAKLSLLRSSMDGYGMNSGAIPNPNLNPNPNASSRSGMCNLLYSVCVCGLFHPAATQHFAQHWNEAGLTRLRSSLDVCTRDIIKALRLRAMPAAINLTLHTQQLVCVCLSSDYGYSDLKNIMDTLNAYTHIHTHALNDPEDFLAEAKHLVHKMDEALREAILAREGMMTYMKFVMEMSKKAQQTEQNTPEQTEAMSLTYMEVCMNARTLFDPRLERAPSTEVEEICATHLYAHFENKPLPFKGTAQQRHLRERICNFADSVENVDSNLLQSLQGYVCASDKEVESRSLSQQVHILEQLLQKALSDVCVVDAESADHSYTYVQLPIHCIKAYDLKMISMSKWQPQPSNPSPDPNPNPQWLTSLCLCMIDDDSSLYVCVFPQVVSPAHAETDTHARTYNPLACKVSLEGINTLEAVSVYTSPDHIPNPKSSDHAVLCVGTNHNDEQVLVQISLQDLQFEVLNPNPNCTEGDLAIISDMQQLQELEPCDVEFKSRVIPNTHTHAHSKDRDDDTISLFGCGSRGVCVCVSSRGRLTIFDIEEDEDDEDENELAEDEELDDDGNEQSTAEEKSERVLTEHK